MESIEVIFNTLKESAKPLKAGELAEITGIGNHEVNKCIKSLVTDEKVYSPKRCYYQAK